MEINSLSSSILTSKATVAKQGDFTGKVSAEKIQSDLDTIISTNAGLLHQNTKAAAGLSENTQSDNFFLSLDMPKAKADGSYTVDGVSFSQKELEQSRAVMQAAVTGIETSGELDYINYVQMSIAANAVRSFAETNLSEEQGAVLENAMQSYSNDLLSNQEALLSGGSYATSSAGTVSDYYGVQKTYSDAEITTINSLIDEMNRVSGGSKAHIGSGFTSVTTCATNTGVIQNISDLFSSVDLKDSAAVGNALERYKSLMTPVYLAAGINNDHGSLSRVLDNSAGKLSAMIADLTARAGSYDVKLDAKA